ncbi:MFS transporter [Chloroflexota bacterium]
MVPLFVVAHFSHHLVMALLQPLLPFIRDEFTISYTQASWIASSFTLAYGLSQLPAGWLADRIGPRILILIGTSGVAACGLFIGLSPTYIIMVIPMILMGVLGGSYHPAASPLVSASVDEKNRGRALGLHQIGGTGSYFLTPLIAVGVAALLGGWRGSFISMSIVTILLGIGLYWLLGRRGYAGQSKTRASKSSTEDVLTQVHQRKTFIDLCRKVINFVIRWRKLIAFIILGVVLQVAIFSTISFVTLFSVDHLRISKEAAAGLLTLAHFAGLWAGPLGGYLSDRIGAVPILLFVCLITGPFIYLLGLTSPGWSVSVVLLVLGACQYMGMPVTEAYIISHISERNRSTVLGFYYFASRGGPGLVMPALGYLLDRSGFATGFTVMGIASLAITLCCVPFLWAKRD